MRILYPGLCFLLLLLPGISAVAQTCTGSFGEPVQGSEDFGTGPGTKLPDGQTTLTYTTDCVNDGDYNIAKTSPSCRAGWHFVATDRSGNGNMMIINASDDPSVFYEKQVDNLCPNTTYRFSVYLLNLIRKSFDNPNVRHPKISLSIETSDGAIIRSPSPQTIPPTDDPEWVLNTLEFTTTAAGTIKLKITNDEKGGLGNDLIIDDITFSPCGPQTTVQFVAVSGSTQDICIGNSINYQLEGSVANAAYQNYQWQQNINNTGWQDISLAANSTARSKTLVLNSTAPPAGSYSYRVGVTQSGSLNTSACRIYSDALTVTVHPMPVADVPAAFEFCEGETIRLTALGGQNYRWTGAGLMQTVPILEVPNATPAMSGTYYVSAISAAGCESVSKSFTITVHPRVNASVATVLPVCAGNSVQLNAGGGVTYKWMPSTGLDRDDIPNPMAMPASTTTYTVNVGDGGICSATATITVTVLKRPEANMPGAKEIQEGESIMLDANTAGDEVTYSWLPATGLDNPASATPVASPKADITYTLTVTSQNCGIATGSVFVRVYKKIIVPNTFTPNGDGFNDTWAIKDLDTYPESIVAVFNRAGQQVYRSIGYGRAWDGSFNGSALPAGTYYYVIDLKNKTPLRKGFIMLLR